MDDHDHLGPEDKRMILRNVAAYRVLRQQVRRKANWGLVWGAVMLGSWYLIYGQGKGGPQVELFSMIHLGLAVLELGAALWNKVWPSAEGVLVDALVIFAFGASNLVRAFLFFQGGNKDTNVYIALGFGGYMMFAGFNHLRSYLRLRGAFAAYRPTADHVRWFDGLLRDVRRADPDLDPTAVDLPTRPPVRGKLLGDTALFLQPGSDLPLVAAREDVEIIRRPSGDPEWPNGYLVIDGTDFGKFPLDQANWRNYAGWKVAGGQPPPPMPARRARDDR